MKRLILVSLLLAAGREALGSKPTLADVKTFGGTNSGQLQWD